MIDGFSKTIGGMAATGCSGSETFSCSTLNVTENIQANAVRYGTARGEWFLNFVSSLGMVGFVPNPNHGEDSCASVW
jgi:hypothetical protein